MIIIALFIAGTIIGSFMNVCIYRLPGGESIIKPRSRCISCGKAIAWFDNIPILSFLALRGRCRSCKKTISIRYPIVEIISGIMCALLFTYFGFTAKSFILLVFSCALVVVSFIDFAIQEIPDVITLPGIVIGLISAALFPSLVGSPDNISAFFNSFLGVLAGGGTIYILGFVGEFIFKKEAMGGGDVKLLAMIGAFIGWKLAIFTFFLAPFFGAAVGITLKLKDGREIIPYGPYLSLAAIVAIFYGDAVIGKLFIL
ncbi:MAG: prepilin peptidase [Candidatus Omnitrophota bacterium]